MSTAQESPVGAKSVVATFQHPDVKNIIEGHDTLVPLNQIPKILPLRSNGKRIHISACYRWITRGVRGIRLEAVRIGGSTYTSHEALTRFTAALSQRGNAIIAPVLIARGRQRQIDHATARLKELLK